MARSDEEPHERLESPREFADFFRPPWWHRETGEPPQIDLVDPLKGEVGSEVTIRGLNLDGARVLFGDAEARVLRSETYQLVVEVPAAYGELQISVETIYGSSRAADLFRVLTAAPGAPGYTFRGDALSYGGDLYSSIKPIGLNQPYLVLMVQPTDVSLPTGQTAATLQANLIAKLGVGQPPFPANSANGFWWEATYGKVSFRFDVDPTIWALPKAMADYFRFPAPRRLTGAGVTFPVSFPAAENLDLQGDAGFTATATFPQAPTTLNDAVARINMAIDNAYSGPAPPPLVASPSGTTSTAQLVLSTTKEDAAGAVLAVSGTAVARLGLAVPPAGTAAATPGVNEVLQFNQAIIDALTSRVAGLTFADAKALLSGYAGVIVAFVGPNTLLRARADLGADHYPVLLPGTPAGDDPEQFVLSALWITTGHPFEVFTHEIGHNLGLPDLYQEPGQPIRAGVELGRWDIMADNSAARHTTSWSKAFKSRDPSTNTFWMDPGEIEVLTPPPASGTKTARVLLVPLESKMPPAGSQFYTDYQMSHPGVPMRHALRLELEPNRSLYVENRQSGPYSDLYLGTVNYSRQLPGPNGRGVIVTDAVNDTTGLPVLRKEVVLLTPMNDPLDNPGEQQTAMVFTATNSIAVQLVEVSGFMPEVYLVEVTWGQGPYFDFRIRDWSPPPWESPDIWIDTRVDNAWDVYTHSNSTLNPGVPGNPVLNGDRSRVNFESRVYARVWNDGQIPKTGVRVRFQIVVPAAMGPSIGTDIGEDTIDLPAGGSALAMVRWTPANANQGHVCVQALVDYDTGELNANNNMAQENITDWYLAGSPPYEPVGFDYQVTNPLPRRTHIRLRARGLLPGWFLDVDSPEFWLEPDETIQGTARIRADARVPLENADVRPPIITLEALAQQGDTWVPFGGISGTAHAVRKAKLDLDVTREEETIAVGGRASTETDVVRGANVTLRLLAPDGRREVDFHQATTDAGGEFQAAFRARSGKRAPRYLEALLSPTLGSGPAEVAPVDLDRL